MNTYIPSNGPIQPCQDMSILDEGHPKDPLTTNIIDSQLLSGSFMECHLPYLHEQQAPSTL